MIDASSIDHLEGVALGSTALIDEWVGARTAMVVTDRRLAEERRVRAVIDRSGAPPVVIEPTEPTFESVSDAVTAIGAASPEVVVGVGGGSVLDTAKLAAAVVGSGGAVSDYVGGARPFSATIPVVAVPTTSGAGAEVSRTAVVSSPTTKTWAWDPLLRPGHVVLDPTLTASMPDSVTVSTGLDAFVHAIEAATAVRSRPDLTDRAIASVSSIRLALPMAVADPSDVEARTAMLVSSVVAGWAIDQAGTGAGHAVGHALASLMAVPHGLAVAFGMTALLDWTLAEAQARRTFDRLGEDVADEIEALTRQVDLDGRVARFACRRIDRTRLADELRKPEHRPMRANGARPITDADVVSVGGLVAARWNGLT